MIKLFGIIEEVQSEMNGKIQILGGLEGPRILVGGISQSGWLVKKIWESALKRIKKEKPVCASVLILGLGGGSSATLIPKYYKDAQITGLDIDPVIVDMGKKYLGLSEVQNMEVVIADARSWVKKSKEKYDLILIDLFQGTKIPDEFYQEEFLLDVQKLLKDDGIVAFNHLYSNLEKQDANRLLSTLRNVFIGIVSVQPEANIIFVCFQG